MIRMNDFKAEPEELRAAEMDVVRRVLDSGWYVLGDEVRAFESAWADRCGTSAAIGVGNGMDAIEITLRALDIGAGDEVITTSMTAFATVLAILRSGATPVFADIDLNTGLLNRASVERCITPRTRAVLLVHLYGQLRDMGAWVDLCEKKDVVLLEDCAQAHLASWDGKPAGGFGRAGAYSFFPTKNLGAIGDGGAVVSNDDELLQRAGMLRNYGQSVRYHHPEQGLNSRLDEIQAALLQVRLQWLQEFTCRRQAIASHYHDNIDTPLVKLLDKPIVPENHVYHLFVILADQRDRLQKHLESRGVMSLIHYPVPTHKQPPCIGLPVDPAGLDAVDLHASRCLSIPCHPQMSAEDVDSVITALNDFC